MPPEPQAIDPTGPREYTWPTGWFNFGNVILILCLISVATLLILTGVAG